MRRRLTDRLVAAPGARLGALRDLPLIADLRDRGVLNPPRLRPRYLDDPDAMPRMVRASQLESLSELIGVAA